MFMLIKQKLFILIHIKLTLEQILSYWIFHIKNINECRAY